MRLQKLRKFPAGSSIVNSADPRDARRWVNDPDALFLTALVEIVELNGFDIDRVGPGLATSDRDCSL